MTRDEINNSWKDICDIHEKYLSQHGVHLPGKDTSMSIWLSVLLYNYKKDKNKWIHKTEMSQIVSEYRQKPPADEQMRHLKRSGWWIENDGKGRHRFLDPYKVSPEFKTEQQRRKKVLNAKDFNEIKEGFDYRCASCGSKEGETSWRYGNPKELIKLQESHRDPDKELDNDNTIPQCQWCNKAYMRDFTFDEKGRVRAVASIEPVKRASRVVKQKVFEYLKDFLKK